SCRSTCDCGAGSARPELFLEPVQLDFHLADLLIELGQQLLLVLLLRDPLIRKQCLGRVEQLLFPLGNLTRMHLVLTSQLRDAAMTFDRLDRHPRLQGRRELSPLTSHDPSPYSKATNPP